ncbi:MAG: hypothetical protein K9H64_09975 [Bacteroidales bacterium]|nr:hypothetical protein [Bacteroidales bacterium]MCF8456195.1 hypothetical protein [Bacteroidales bacterium]
MKKNITYIYLLILLFVGLNIESQAQEIKEKQNQITGQTTSANNCYMTGYYDFFNHDANMKTSQQLVQHILPSFQKFPFGVLFNEKVAELFRNRKILKYILIAKFQVVRFEGPDIIHPFNYFW